MAGIQKKSSEEAATEDKSIGSVPALSAEECKKFEELDYVRFTFSDIHGIGRCKSVARRHVQQHLTRGVDVFSGIVAVGPRSNLTPVYSEIKEANFGNSILHPMPGTLRVLPWAADGKFKVGEVLCESYWTKPFRNGGRQEACPRYVARKQLDALDKLGLLLYSSFEVEFKVYHADTHTPIFDNDMFSTRDLSKYESYLYDIDHNLIQAGVDIGTIQIEYSEGQFEFALKPYFGIESSDAQFRAKHYIKEITELRSKNLEAVFMSRPEPESVGNGLHFNHSVWRKDDKKTNAFYNSADSDGLSQIARYWLAGLVKHAGALTALCSPTVNCYRRLHSAWAPYKATWGIDDRMSTFRVKNTSQSETYVENRCSAGSANPYLVLAATVAAGMAGIVNKYAPVDPAVEVLLPKSLSEALDALERDEILVAALGEEFVRWFVSVKRALEIEVLSNDSIEEEKKMYWKMF